VQGLVLWPTPYTYITLHYQREAGSKEEPINLFI
jgi:hypothetical protein